MVKKRVYQSFVVATNPVGESDLLVVLLTRETGKIRCIAKGAKKSKKRFMNVLEPFAHIDAVTRLASRSDLHFLESGSLKDGFESVRQDYRCFLGASLCLELVDLWCREGQREPEIYNLLWWYLKGLEAGRDVLVSTLIFQARLLDASGHMPPLGLCNKCGETITGRTVAYDPVTGQVACSRCSSGDGRYVMGVSSLKSIEFWTSQPLDKVFRLRINGLIMEETWKYLKTVHSGNLEKTPQSYRFLDELIK